MPDLLAPLQYSLQISVIEPIAQTATRRFNSLVVVLVLRPRKIEPRTKDEDEDEDDDEKTGIEFCACFEAVKAFR